jgi:hypothetical protein
LGTDKGASSKSDARKTKKYCYLSAQGGGKEVGTCVLRIEKWKETSR